MPVAPLGEFVGGKGRTCLSGGRRPLWQVGAWLAAHLLFSLTIHEVNLGLRRAHPELRSIWYLDDGTLMGSPEEVVRGYEFVAAECWR